MGLSAEAILWDDFWSADWTRSCDGQSFSGGTAVHVHPVSSWCCDTRAPLMGTLVLPFTQFRMTKALQPFGPLMLGDGHDRRRDRGEQGETGAPSFVNCEDHQEHQTVLSQREILGCIWRYFGVKYLQIVIYSPDFAEI